MIIEIKPLALGMSHTMENSLTGQELGKYQIGPLIGVGGMGEVYQAENSESGDSVAIKFLRSEFTDDPEFQGRFVREIRIMEALEHENIMPILDHGIINGSQLYYTMKLINGMSFSTMMKRSQFSPASYWSILEQLAQGLAHGHAEGVVHRDIKPDNIFIEREAGKGFHVILGDFGLGKRKGVDKTMTEADAVIGTPHYMAPESILGEKNDKRSDIYSIAVLTYEALLSVLPFDEPYAHATAIAHVTKPVPIPETIHPEFPRGLQEVLMKGLEKSPETRHQTIEEFAEHYQTALAELDDDIQNEIFYADE